MLQHADGHRRLAVARRELNRLRPDVVAFQEVTRTDSYDPAVDLLGDGYEVVSHPSPSENGASHTPGSWA